MSPVDPILTPSRLRAALPRHLADWTLPPGWSWGQDSVWGDRRHYQEVVDALGRSLSLVSAPDPTHADWLRDEARALAHRNHPSIPTTYHYWANYSESRRGPGYLRRWIAGETVAQRVVRMGPESVPTVLQVLREAGSALAYLHDAGALHRALSAYNVWLTPGGRLWLLGWEWALQPEQVPDGLSPDPARTPQAPEWRDGKIAPTLASDQWQLAAMVFTALTGETPPERDAPPITLLRPDCPVGLARALEQALHADPRERFPSVRTFLREVDRVVSLRAVLVEPEGDEIPTTPETPEARLRWATGDDYEILAPLGSGTFGSVWRARDLTLAREVAIKVLHPHIAKDDVAVTRFRREARLAAQLAHPAIVPIYDSDERGGVVWYTMELAEGGSVASLVARRGPRDFESIAMPVDGVLDGLLAAHASGIIHRDLKPENILIDRYRRWRIGDFGIAQAWGEDPATGSSGRRRLRLRSSSLANRRARPPIATRLRGSCISCSPVVRRLAKRARSRYWRSSLVIASPSGCSWRRFLRRSKSSWCADSIRAPRNVLPTPARCDSPGVRSSRACAAPTIPGRGGGGCSRGQWTRMMRSSTPPC